MHTRSLTASAAGLLVPFLLSASGCGGTAGAFNADTFIDPSELAGRASPSPVAASLAAASPTAGLAPYATTAAPADAGQAIAAKPAGEPAAAAAAATAPADKRVVVYSAGYRVVVADVPGTLRAIQQAAERLGGYMQEVSGLAVTVRVPAGRFADACRAVEDAGDVVDRQVRAADVTEEMRDLRLRVENAERLRQRLVELLAKADKVEDAIKVEAELARVSEQLDVAKGKIRFLESRAAMSTVRVDLNPAAAANARGTGPRLPFAWVEQLGDGLVAGQVPAETRRLGFFARGPRFAPPPGFVRYYEAEDQTDAMDGDGLRLRVQRRANADKAPLAFWAKLARRALVEGRAVAVTAEEGDASVYVVRGTRDVGGRPVGYLLAVKRSDGAVAVFEAWGPKAQVDAAAAALRASAVSVDPG